MTNPPTFGESLSKLQRRMQKMQTNEAVLPSKPAHEPLGVVLDDYLNPYVRQLTEIIWDGRPCFLLGALGIGKTEVLHRAKAQIEATGRGQCVFINIGQHHMRFAPLHLLQLLVDGLYGAGVSVEVSKGYDPEGALREMLYDWMRDNQRDVVLMLDQVELLDLDHDVLNTVRALLQQQDLYAQKYDLSARFIAVLSGKSMRKRLMDVSSPLYNIVVDEVRMLDCEPEIRQQHWRRLLGPIAAAAREPLVNQLDRLCGGDPYQIVQASARVKQVLADAQATHPNTEYATAQHEGDTLSRSVTYLISEIRNQPEAFAPYIARYAELMEDDLEALHLMIRLEGGESVTVREMRPRLEGRTASLWDGVFTHERNRWAWRSELTRVYFVREFLKQPQRTARSLRRKNQFGDAVEFLRQFRHHNSLAVQVLQDVVTGWINDASFTDEAWQRLARVMAIWFDDPTHKQVQVLRFYPYRQNAHGDYGAYFQVLPHHTEALADGLMTVAVQRAYQERFAEANNLDIAGRQFADEAGRVIFPLIRARGEYGAVVWSRTAYEREVGPFDKKQDHMDRWIELLNGAAGEIVELQERQVLKEQVANSLKVEDYELIEAEYSHQWNKRIRQIRDYAKWSLEDLGNKGPDALPEVLDWLKHIEQLSREAIERLRFTSKINHAEAVMLKPWLTSRVNNWNMLNSKRGVQYSCEVEASINDETELMTRPIILEWILNELMTNALEAELNAGHEHKTLFVNARVNERGEYEVRLSNPTRMPRAVLQAVLSGNPLERPNKRGRGIWIAAGQVQALLGGTLRFPKLEDENTTFTLVLPRVISKR